MLCTGIPSGQSPEALPGTPRETPTRDPPFVPGKQPGVWPLQYSASGLRGTVPCQKKSTRDFCSLNLPLSILYVNRDDSPKNILETYFSHFPLFGQNL